MVAECGPGKVLAGLTKRCGADNINGVALADAASIDANLNLGKTMLNGQLALVTGASRGIGRPLPSNWAGRRHRRRYGDHR